jgi:hypothetical protein
MKKFSFELNVSVSKNWVEDGWDSDLIKDRLKEFIEMYMNPYAYAHIEFQAEIKNITKKPKRNKQ